MPTPEAIKKAWAKVTKDIVDFQAETPAEFTCLHCGKKHGGGYVCREIADALHCPDCESLLPPMGDYCPKCGWVMT